MMTCIQSRSDEGIEMTKEERTKKKGSFRICFDLSACNLLDKANRYNIYLIVRAVENDLTEYEVGGNWAKFVCAILSLEF